MKQKQNPQKEKTRETAQRKPGLSSKARLRLTYILLVSILVLLAVLIVLIPRREEAPAIDSPSQTESAVSEKAVENSAPVSEGASAGKVISEKTATDTQSSIQRKEIQQEPQNGPLVNPSIEGKPRAGAKGKPATARRKGKLCIVIDDVGHNTFQLEPFLALPIPLTFAILPGLQYTAKAGEMIAKAGKSLILHQPMEAEDGENPGPGAIYSGMETGEVISILEKNFREVPHAFGMNNHMGSKVTKDKRIMFAVLSYMKEKKLLFLDSLTTAESSVAEIAPLIGLSYARRDVFLDNEKDKEAVVKEFNRGLNIAGSKGKAILIGHVWSKELYEVIVATYTELIAHGYDFVSLEDVMREGN